MMTIAELYEIIATAYADSIAMYRERQDRVLAKYAEVNQDRAATIDSQGRLHAPCDGYYDYYAEEVRAGGEYLAAPREDDDEYWHTHCDIGPKTVNCEKVKLLISASEMVDRYTFSAFRVEASCGAKFNRDGVIMCYLYLTGHTPTLGRVNRAIAEYNEANRIAREKEWADEKAKAGDSPEGRVEITGTIVSIKIVETAFGVATKMLVKLENGSTVYGTMPKRLESDPAAQVGSVVTFTGTFEKSKDDHSHSFFSRPK